MIIATRSLSLRTGKDNVDVAVRLHAPERQADDWICRYEIDWPRQKAERWGTGGDGIQAILHALQMIGAELYASEHHEAGRLSWLEAGAGYGFPVTQSIRDLLVGDDKRFL